MSEFIPYTCVDDRGNYGFIPIQKGDEHGKNNIGAATVAIGYALKLEKD